MRKWTSALVLYTISISQTPAFQKLEPRWEYCTGTTLWSSVWRWPPDLQISSPCIQEDSKLISTSSSGDGDTTAAVGEEQASDGQKWHVVTIIMLGHSSTWRWAHHRSTQRMCGSRTPSRTHAASEHPRETSYTVSSLLHPPQCSLLTTTGLYINYVSSYI